MGEVGSQNKSVIYAVNYVCDGSGGYFWGTDTSIIFANNVIVYTTVRSERNALVVLANSWLPFSPPSAIHKSILICSQNKLAYKPIAYDQSVVWNLQIDNPDTAYNNTTVPISGSAWIKQGPGGNIMEFDSYSISFKNSNDSKWTYISRNNSIMVEEALLEEWNTKGLTPGYYILRLTVKDNFGDTVEAFKVVVLKPLQISVKNYSSKNKITISPNPFSCFLTINFGNNLENHKISIFNSLGQQVKTYENIKDENFIINRENISSGVYFLRVENENSEFKTFRILIY